MKKAVLLGVLVSLAVVATAFLLIRHRIPYLTTRQTTAHAGTPDADWRDNDLWRKTPEYKVVQDKLKAIATAADVRGFPTADEVEVLIEYIHSPHYETRETALIVAGSARSDPARAMLIPSRLRSFVRSGLVRAPVGCG